MTGGTRATTGSGTGTVPRTAEGSSERTGTAEGSSEHTRTAEGSSGHAGRVEGSERHTRTAEGSERQTRTAEGSERRTATAEGSSGRTGRAGREEARWTRAVLGPGGRPLDLLTARFDRHRYAPHTHDEFTIGVSVGGSELIGYRGGQLRTGPGSIVVLAPGEIHTGGPAAPEGYAYRALYVEPSLLAEGTAGGLPHFREGLLDDPELAAALRAAHTELSLCPDPLEAESRLPWLLAALTRRHSTARPDRDHVPGAARIADAVRDRLSGELQAPPSLASLAADLGLSRYQLLRAFRSTTGIPPYAWLAQYRVHRARGLLESGLRPAEAAALVGFADQAHLTRWFRRVLGVTPAAYRASVLPSGT